MTRQSPNAIAATRRSFIAGATVTALMPQTGTAASRGAPRYPVRLHDMQVTDARSQRRFMLLRDLLRGRVAVVNFMFTGCSTVCPMQAALLSRTQRSLAGEMGKEVLFLSISITPLTDTPEALVRFAEMHGAGAGWHFLRASLGDTQRFQSGFDSLAPRVEDHPPVFAIGRADEPRWSRLYGAPKPRKIASEVRDWLGRG